MKNLKFSIVSSLNITSIINVKVFIELEALLSAGIISARHPTSAGNPPSFPVKPADPAQKSWTRYQRVARQQLAGGSHSGVTTCVGRRDNHRETLSQGEAIKSFLLLFLSHKHRQNEHCFHGNHYGMPNTVAGRGRGGGCFSRGNKECVWVVSAVSQHLQQRGGGSGVINICCRFHPETGGEGGMEGLFSGPSRCFQTREDLSHRGVWFSVNRRSSMMGRNRRSKHCPIFRAQVWVRSSPLEVLALVL
ncbi:hypothetical protein CRENBAI_009339 [Crenichthys baileyi]|uniref:Uncharacterized protein n=1 Tax=Crenichthys baileyi TaxID=28760 RepID=A0AAV9RMI8_9TELE